MAIGYARFTFVGGKGGTSAVCAAAYRHRAAMVDRKTGKSVSFSHKHRDLKHSEVSIPADAPQWIVDLMRDKSAVEASEALWNIAQDTEVRIDATVAREMLLALPVELSLEENIALVREFVETHLTSKGIVADWVIHGAKDNPHVHLLHTVRPLSLGGFGPKVSAVLGDDGQPLRVVTNARPGGQIVYQQFVGERSVDRAWKMGWAEAANRHLALAGHDIQIDMRSYSERGLDLKPQRHLGASMAAMVREGKATHFAPAQEAARFEMADQLAANPGQVLSLLSQQQSTFTERDIARAIHRHVDEVTVFQNIKAAVLASPEICLLRPAKPADPASGAAGQPAVYTTRELLKIEHEMAEASDRLARAGGFGVKDNVVARAIRKVETKDASKPFKFDDEQVEAVRHVTGADGLAAVVGYAGAGKSTLLEAANVAWTERGHRVFGAALAGKAAEGLEESSGIASRTLASWELAWKNGNAKLQKGDVFVIDEAGMVSSRQLARFVAAVEAAGAKLVLVGDAQQLQPIEAGAAFRAIIDRAGAKTLIGVRRQRAEWMQEASRQFASGDVEKFGQALAAYKDAGAIRQVVTTDQARAALVEDWTQKRAEVRTEKQAKGEDLRGDEFTVLAHTNANVRALNASLRQVLKDAGELSDARQFLTEAGQREFAVGDRLLFLENASFIEPSAPDLDRQSVKNGMLGTVVATTDDTGHPRLTVRLDAGREVIFSTDTYRNFDHGYATTIHKSQGATVDHAFVLASSMMDQHLTYVAMSRHRHTVKMYAPQDEFSDQRGGHHVAAEGRSADDATYQVLKERLSRSGAKSTTLDFEDEPLYREHANAFLERRGMQALRDIAPAISAVVETQANRLEQYREALADLWDRASHALMRTHVAERAAAEPTRSAAHTAPDDPVGATRPTLLPSRTEHPHSVIQDARARFEQSATGHHHDVELSRRLAQIYRQPALAKKAITDAAMRMQGSSASLAEQILQRPDSFGELRGSGRLIDGRPARAAREEAMLALPEAATIARMQSVAWNNDQGRHVSAETRRREAMAIAIPALSDAARAQLDTLAALREKGGPDAWRKGFEVTQKDAGFGSEIRALNDALNARFGFSAFTAKADRHTQDLVNERIPAENKAAFMAEVPMMREARIVAAALQVSNKREMNKAEAVTRVVAQPAPAAVTAAAPQVEAPASPTLQMPADKLAAAAPALPAAVTAAAPQVEAPASPTLQMPADKLAAAAPALPAAVTAAAPQVEAPASPAPQMPADKLAPAAPALPAAVTAAAPQMAPEKPAPMFAAVTHFAEPIEHVADRRAWARPDMVKSLDALKAAAHKVWTDPDRAVTQIRSRIQAGATASTLQEELTRSPQAFAPLRGSSRMIDRFTTAGAERKQALEAVKSTIIEARELHSGLANYREIETKAEAEHRRRMAIEVPGFSKEAAQALEKVRAAKGYEPRRQAVEAIPATVRDEIAQVDKALRARFGNYDTAQVEDLQRRVSPDQKQKLEVARTAMSGTHSVVRMTKTIQNDAQRNKTIGRGNTLNI
ncbi:MAG: Ti-type conjugative transfer relaxase TraA [Sphingobium sp.]